MILAGPVAALGVPAAGLTYALGSLICHQQAERSFALAASQLPVCARCFGLYAGFAAGAVASIVAGRGLGVRAAAFSGAEVLRWSLIAAAVPTALTWIAETAGVVSPGNWVRFVAALPLGAAVALTVNYFECARTRPSGSRRRPTHI